MRLYKTTITPTSNFITSLKGETKLTELLKNYATNPFLIVSDGFASGYLPKPTLPSSLLNEKIEDKKQNRKNVWLTLNQLKNAQYNQAITDKKAKNINKSSSIVKNSINYKTFNTGNGFDPHSETEYCLSQKDIFFLLDDAFSLSELKEVFSLVSQMGYGKDSSTGKGRFELENITEIELNQISNTYMALSPFVTNSIKCKDIYYEPFTRFGKSGASRANKNPFKKPFLLADVGAVVVYEEKKELNYIGKAIKNISSYKDMVHQGYTIVVSIKDI